MCGCWSWSGRARRGRETVENKEIAFVTEGRDRTEKNSGWNFEPMDSDSDSEEGRSHGLLLPQRGGPENRANKEIVLEL